MEYLVEEYCNEKEDHYLDDDYIFKKLNKDINKTKSLIDDYPSEWEIVKKQIHDHEYVYTSSYIGKNLSTIVPISRSYFKFVEIYKEFNLLNKNSTNKVVCIAEAPGGFIQGAIDLFYDNIISSDMRDYCIETGILTDDHFEKDGSLTDEGMEERISSIAYPSL